MEMLMDFHRAPSSPCRQCTRPDCPPATLIFNDSDQPFDSVSTGSSEDADLVPVQSGEDWIARLDDDLSRPVGTSGDSFRISALQREDPVCVKALRGPKSLARNRTAPQ